MKRLKLLLIASFFLLTACNEERFEALNKQQPILSFGDSLTAGVGASEADAYPQRLASITGLEVINVGISGETTKQGLARLPSVLDEHQPQLVILLEGGNDILRNHNLSQTKQNLASMIEEIQSRNIQLLFLGVPEKKLFSDSAPLYNELAIEYDLVFDGETLSDLLRKRKYKSDPIHLNALGYKKLAERINDIFVEQGAL